MLRDPSLRLRGRIVHYRKRVQRTAVARDRWNFIIRQSFSCNCRMSLWPLMDHRPRPSSSRLSWSIHRRPTPAGTEQTYSRLFNNGDSFADRQRSALLPVGSIRCSVPPESLDRTDDGGVSCGWMGANCRLRMPSDAVATGPGAGPGSTDWQRMTADLGSPE